MTLTNNSGTIQSSQNVKPTKVKLVIHNQSPGIELISPVYACEDKDAKCLLPPNQRVDFGFTAQYGLIINSRCFPIKGILMYKLQGKNTAQFNEDGIYSEEASCIQLFMVWSVNDHGNFSVFSCLIEHDKNCVWNRDRLMRLTNSHWLKFIHGPVETTYLMRDNTVLMTRMNVTREEEYHRLEMTISETSVKDDTWRPKYIDANG
jgi:hypothetical protein